MPPVFMPSASGPDKLAKSLDGIREHLFTRASEPE